MLFRSILHEEHRKFGLQFNVHPAVVEKELKEYEEADFISIPSNFVRTSFIEHGVGCDGGHAPGQHGIKILGISEVGA